MISLLFSLILNAPAAQDSFLSDLENFRNQSLSLKTEKQNHEATSDQLLSRRLFWTPRLSVSAVQNQTQVHGSGLSSSQLSQTDEKYLQADASLNLYRAGGDWNLMKSAQALNKAQELTVLNEDLKVEIKASDLIFKSLYLTETQNIQTELLKLKEESLKIVSDRYHQGKLPLQEVTKSEVDLVQQKAKVRLAQLDVAENRSLIASAFVTDIQTKSWPFNENLNPKLQPTQKLPLIEQKYWTQASKEQDWRSARAGHWPSLDLTVQYQQFPIERRETDQWVGYLTLSLPLWSQYETSAKISSNYAQYIAALNDFKDTEQTLKQRLGFLKEKIEIARVNLAEAKKNLEKAKGLYQDVLKSFRLGRISTNDLFLEQNRLLDSQNSLAVSQLSFHQALIETCALAGLRSSECLK